MAANLTAPNSAAAIVEKYDQDYGELTRARQVASDLAAHLLPGPVVHVGTGAGLGTLGLRELGYRVIALDNSADWLGQARERLGPVPGAPAASVSRLAAGADGLQIVYKALFEGIAGLRLAVPARQLRFRQQAAIYGIEELPVTW